MILAIATNPSSIVPKAILTRKESAGAIQAKTLVRLFYFETMQRLTRFQFI